MNKEVSVIIPAYNEENAIPLVLKECAQYADEIVVVDDGSSDRTAEEASKFNIKLIRHDRNLGKVAAIRTGIRNSSGKFIVLLDADYTYPCRYIPDFIRELKNGADLVLGDRVSTGKKNIPAFNRIGNRILSFVISFLGATGIRDAQTGYRVFRREIFDKLDVEAEGLEYETKMTLKAARIGYKIKEMPIEYRKRIGRSKLNPMKDGYRMLSSIISTLVRETSVLGKVMLFPSVAFFMVGLAFGVISVMEKIHFEKLVHEYYPLISVFLVLMSIQLFSYGIIFEHIFNQIRGVR